MTSDAVASAETSERRAECPHGDPTCPCPDGDPCHYQGGDAWPCPSTGLALGHCHIEGCSWRVVTGWHDGQRVEGECGLLKLGLPPLLAIGGAPFYSMNQAKPGLPGWACGWLRSPGNEASSDGGKGTGGKRNG